MQEESQPAPEEGAEAGHTTTGGGGTPRRDVLEAIFREGAPRNTVPHARECARQRRVE